MPLLLEGVEKPLAAGLKAFSLYGKCLYPDPPLFGTTPIERAVIEMWNRRMEFELLRPIIDYFVHSSAFYKERLTHVADIADHDRMHANARMDWLNGELAMRPVHAGERD